MLYRKLAKLMLIMSDKARGRCVYACRNSLEKTQWMNKRDLQRLQFKRLLSLLKHAYESVPYYHHLFREVGLKPSEVKSLEDIAKVPPLKRSALSKNRDSLLARNTEGNRLLSWQTSGTTAAPLKFYRSRADVSWGIGSELRGYGWAGYEVGDKLGLLWIVKPDQSRSFVFKLRKRFGRNTVLNVSKISVRTMSSFARELHRVKPDFIRGYTGATGIFANFLMSEGKYAIHPGAVFTSAATLYSYNKKAIEEAFGCRVYDYYAASEVSHVAAQCGLHEGLHVSDENILMEVVKDGEPVAPGEDGQILLTNLHSHAMPFIRYEIGDSGKILHDTCSCGRQLSLMKPEGRTYEYFLNSDGSFTSLRDFQTVFEDLPIKEFQVIQENYDEIVIKIAGGRGYNQKHTDFILKNIKDKGSANIRVELVDSIPTESGKVRHLVSKIVSPYLTSVE
jgi:phenylacetate-CoA ligase